MPYLNTPVNLSHAATVARRICARIAQSAPQETDCESLEQASLILAELYPYSYDELDPSPPEQMIVVSHTLDLTRHLVNLIQIEKIGNDRIGQSIRNLYECLGRSEEGNHMGLLAGENPNSFQRPKLG